MTRRVADAEAVRDDDPWLWSVDRSWSNYRGNSDGELAPSDMTKHHIDRGNTTAKCSKRVLLNSLPGDVSGGRLSDFEREWPESICRRCVPKKKEPQL